MRILLAILALSVPLAVVGCAGGGQDRPLDTVQATGIHKDKVREKLWEDLHKKGEKEARERMERDETTD